MSPSRSCPVLGPVTEGAVRALGPDPEGLTTHGYLYSCLHQTPQLGDLNEARRDKKDDKNTLEFTFLDTFGSERRSMRRLGTGVDTEVNELLGTWSIVSLMFAPVGGGSAVDGLAGTASITFRENLTYTLTFVEAQVTDVEDGTFSVSGSTLTLVEDDDPTLDPNLLTITSINSTSATLFSEDDEQFDFNDEGEETPATLTVSLQKQS